MILTLLRAIAPQTLGYPSLIRTKNRISGPNRLPKSKVGPTFGSPRISTR